MSRTRCKARAKRLVDAIADGAGEFQEVKDRLRSTREELATLQDKLDALSTGTTLTPSPDLGSRYRAYVMTLDAALASDGPARAQAIAAIRSLIDALVLIPKDQGRGVDIRLEGRMAEIINLANRVPDTC